MSSQPGSRTTVAELLLRFGCRRCGQPAAVPVARSDGRDVRCRRCSTALEVPELNEQVQGLDRIVQAHSPACELECPNCRRRLRCSTASLGQRRRCPGCREWLTLTLLAEPPEPEQASSVSAPPPPVGRGAVRGRPPSSRGRPPEPDFDGDDEAEDEGDGYEALAPQVYGGSRAGSRRRGAFGFDSPRAVYWGMYWMLQIGLPLGLFILTGLTEEGLFGVFALLFFIPRLALTRRLTDLIAPCFVPTFSCPGCHEEYEAVGVWKCGCGFQDHRQQHIMRVRCPKCEGRLGYFDCLRCETTIRLC